MTPLTAQRKFHNPEANGQTKSNVDVILFIASLVQSKNVFNFVTLPLYLSQKNG